MRAASVGLVLLAACSSAPRQPAEPDPQMHELLTVDGGPGQERLRAEAEASEALRRHLEESGPPDFLYVEEDSVHLLYLDRDLLVTLHRTQPGPGRQLEQTEPIPHSLFWKLPASERQRVWSVRREGYDLEEEPFEPIPDREVTQPERRSATSKPTQAAPPARVVRETRPRLVFASDTVRVRKSPSTSAEDLGTLAAGDALSVLAHSGEWELVRVVSTGRDGWVQRRHTSRRDPTASPLTPETALARPEFHEPAARIQLTKGTTGFDVMGCRTESRYWEVMRLKASGMRQIVENHVLLDLCRRFPGSLRIEVWAESKNGLKVGVVQGDSWEASGQPWFFASNDLRVPPDALTSE